MEASHLESTHNLNRFLIIILYSKKSPAAEGGRGLVWCRVYTQDGKMVMCVAQEGIIRAEFKDVQERSGVNYEAVNTT